MSQTEFLGVAGQVAVVTGGSRGLGKEIARMFLAFGVSVIITGRKQETITAAAKDLNQSNECSTTRAVSVQADVGLEQDAKRIIQTAIDEFGRLDILVNNAALTSFDIPSKPFLEQPYDIFLDTLRVNIGGPFVMVKTAYEHLKKSGNGRVVNISSIMGEGKYVTLGFGAYGSSKAGLIKLTQEQAAEFGPEVRVNSITPGGIDNENLRKIMRDRTGVPEGQEDSVINEISKNMCVTGRICSNADIASCVIFLSSRAASNITGENITVDGGQVLSQL